MNIRIQTVADKGVLEKERLILRVLSDTDVGEYVLFRAGYRDGSVTTGVRNTLWFPDKAVSKGDLVVVYTKSGRENERRKDDGLMLHFFYWGLNEAIWNSDDHAPVILQVQVWESRGPEEL